MFYQAIGNLRYFHVFEKPPIFDVFLIVELLFLFNRLFFLYTKWLFTRLTDIFVCSVIFSISK